MFIDNSILNTIPGKSIPSIIKSIKDIYPDEVLLKPVLNKDEDISKASRLSAHDLFKHFTADVIKKKIIW